MIQPQLGQFLCISVVEYFLVDRILGFCPMERNLCITATVSSIINVIWIPPFSEKMGVGYDALLNPEITSHTVVAVVYAPGGGMTTLIMENDKSIGFWKPFS